MPCEKSGDFGIHVRVLGAIAVDEQSRIRAGLLAPSLILSAMEAGECGVAFPLRFYDVGLPVPERMRVFCKVSLPKSVLPTSGGAVFANINLAVGALSEAGAPAGPRSTTVDAGVLLGGELGAIVHLGTAFWTTIGEAQPQLHAGAELSVRGDFVTLFAQVQFQNRLGCSLPSFLCEWALLGTFGMSFPREAVPTSLHASLGHGEAAPRLVLALDGGVTFDVKVRARHGDGHEAAERFWDRLVAPLRYRLLLRRRGYYDPYPDEHGLLRDDLDHSVLGILGVPDPTRPGYILTPSGVSIPVGASLEVRGDRPLVASPAFPGRVLSYIPVLTLAKDGGALRGPVLDELYFARLEEERRREELALLEQLRQMDTPWARAAINAAAGLLTDPMLMFLAAAGPDTPDLEALRREARLLGYRKGYEEHKGEIGEILLATYGPLLAGWASGTLRAAAGMTAREVAAGLAGLRTRGTLAAAGHSPRLPTRLGPRLNPLNYRFEIRGLGSNLGNLEVSFVEAEAGEVAEHVNPTLQISAERDAVATTDRTVPSRAPDPDAVPRGRPEVPSKNDTVDHVNSLRRQDESA